LKLEANACKWRPMCLSFRGLLPLAQFSAGGKLGVMSISHEISTRLLPLRGSYKPSRVPQMG